MKADRTIKTQGGLRVGPGIVFDVFCNSLRRSQTYSAFLILCAIVSNRPTSVASSLLFGLTAVGLPGLQDVKHDNDGLSEQQTIRVNVNLVTVGVLVTGGKNRGIEGLKVNDFSILEDGKRQEVVSFSAEEQPISVVILLDKSNSMAEATKMEEAKAL